MKCINVISLGCRHFQFSVFAIRFPFLVLICVAWIFSYCFDVSVTHLHFGRMLLQHNGMRIFFLTLICETSFDSSAVWDMNALIYHIHIRFKTRPYSSMVELPRYNNRKWIQPLCELKSECGKTSKHISKEKHTECNDTWKEILTP